MSDIEILDVSAYGPPQVSSNGATIAVIFMGEGERRFAAAIPAPIAGKLTADLQSAVGLALERQTARGHKLEAAGAILLSARTPKTLTISREIEPDATYLIFDMGQATQVAVRLPSGGEEALFESLRELMDRPRQDHSRH